MHFTKLFMVHIKMEIVITIEAEKKDSLVKDSFQMFPSIVPMALYSAGMLSRVQLFDTLWTVVHQAPLSMKFFMQEYWSREPFLPPGDISDPGIEPASPFSIVLAGRFFTTEPPGKPHGIVYLKFYKRN